jgi:hypothetical protein
VRELIVPLPDAVLPRRERGLSPILLILGRGQPVDEVETANGMRALELDRAAPCPFGLHRRGIGGVSP